LRVSIPQHFFGDFFNSIGGKQSGLVTHRVFGVKIVAPATWSTMMDTSDQFTCLDPYFASFAGPRRHAEGRRRKMAAAHQGVRDQGRVIRNVS
jgi:hypothetical protein